MPFDPKVSGDGIARIAAATELTRGMCGPVPEAEQQIVWHTAGYSAATLSSIHGNDTLTASALAALTAALCQAAVTAIDGASTAAVNPVRFAT